MIQYPKYGRLWNSKSFSLNIWPDWRKGLNLNSELNFVVAFSFRGLLLELYCEMQIFLENHQISVTKYFFRNICKYFFWKITRYLSAQYSNESPGTLNPGGAEASEINQKRSKTCSSLKRNLELFSAQYFVRFTAAAILGRSPRSFCSSPKLFTVHSSI